MGVGRSGNAAGSGVAPRHTIGVVSRVTGLPLDTLRMWERRYGFPRPARDHQGVRYFTETEIEHLRVAATATRLGYRPGDVLSRSLDELRALLAEVTETSRHSASSESLAENVGLLLTALQNLELEKLVSELQRLSTLHGVRGFISGVVSPLLDRVGQSWERGELDIYHERLLSRIIERELGRLTATASRSGGPRAVLGTLPQENHQLPADLFGLSLASAGVAVHNLGTNVSVDQFLRAARALQACVVAISATLSATAIRLRDLLSELALKMPEDAHLWVSGRATERLPALPPRVLILRGWPDLDAALAELPLRSKTPAG